MKRKPREMKEETDGQLPDKKRPEIWWEGDSELIVWGIVLYFLFPCLSQCFFKENPNSPQSKVVSGADPVRIEQQMSECAPLHWR